MPKWKKESEKSKESIIVNKKMKNNLIALGAFFSIVGNAQTIKNTESLSPFAESIKNQNKVTQILFIGDSHTQAGNITDYLRAQFQTHYGNAGRGLLFPYPVGNTNGANDFSAISSTKWDVFRLVHEQDIYPQLGASGFVIGNQSPAMIEITLDNDTFNHVTIFSDPKMIGKEIAFFTAPLSLSHFVRKSTQRVNYQIQEGDTYPELASMFNTTTTQLKAINGASVMNPKPGAWIKADQVSVHYNTDFENNTQSILKTNLKEEITPIQLPLLTRKMLLKTYANDNYFYGFHFSNGQNGVIFNSVGVNGATYADFLKHPIQFRQLKSLHPDLLAIALGTNEGVSKITEEEFKKNAMDLIRLWKSSNKNLPILLITPTDNTMNATKTKLVAQWIVDIAQENNIAYLHLYEEMGGAGYFKKALARKVANKDGVHLLKSGYEEQAQVIWNAFQNYLKK